MTFGEKLRKIMKTRGIKAINLARRMNVSCAYISQLMTGIRKPGRETLLKLSRSLEVPFETLLTTEGDLSDRILISRKLPVLDDAKIHEWADCIDLEYPSLVAGSFEYATTDDPNAFYISPRGLLSCCGLDFCDLILIEPNKEVGSGNTVIVWSAAGVSIRKIVIQENMIILMDDKQEPIVLSKDHPDESVKYYRASQCVRKL